MIQTSRQLKDLVRNLSKSTGIEPHILIRKYMMERILERVSLSSYRNCFIVKGGMLVSDVVGISSRTTMDIDTTVKNLSVDIVELTKTVKQICSIHLEDNVDFKIEKVDKIMDDSEYPGLRFSIVAYLDRAKIPLKIDVSTGDIITPHEIEYSYKLMFEDRAIQLMTYPIETILAEKLETVISRSVANTRMRDFYDIYMLLNEQFINPSVFATALKNTANNRGSIDLLSHTDEILDAIYNSLEMEKAWTSYRNKHKYANKYQWHNILNSINKLCKMANLAYFRDPNIQEIGHLDQTEKAKRQRTDDDLEI